MWDMLSYFSDGITLYKLPLDHSRRMFLSVPWEMKTSAARNQMGKEQVACRVETLSPCLPRDEPSGREGSQTLCFSLCTARGTVWGDESHSKCFG